MEALKLPSVVLSLWAASSTKLAVAISADVPNLIKVSAAAVIPMIELHMRFLLLTARTCAAVCRGDEVLVLPFVL